MGEFYALSCALVWSVAVMFFRKAGQEMPALALNLFRVGLSGMLFLVTALVMGRPLLGVAPLEDYLILIGSGVIAIALSDTFFHLCLNRVGAGLNAIVNTLYAPFTALFAFGLLGERMGPWQLGGMVLIVGAVLIASRVEPPPGTSRRTVIEGIGYGVLAMATLGYGIVLAKPVLVRTDVLWATAVRQIGSMIVLVPVAALLPGRRTYFAVFRPQRAWRLTVPGVLLGSYAALILWQAGMKYTSTGTAAALNQSSTLFTLIFASLFLKERFGKRKAAAAALAGVGIVLVLGPA